MALLIFVFACKKEQAADLSIYDNIVLQVDTFRITEYEYNKNLKQFKESYKAQYQIECHEDSIMQWNQVFINNTYILVDAYRKGYNKNSNIKHAVESMSRAMLTSVNGYLWNTLEVPKLDTSRNAVLNFYEKRSLLVDYVYVKFNSYEDLLTVMNGDSSNITTDKFIKIMDRSRKVKNATSDTIPADYYPFMVCNLGLDPDFIYNMKPGSVSNPILTSQGAFVLYLNDAKHVAPPEIFNKDYEKIRAMLLYKQEQMLIEDNAWHVNEQTQVMFESKSISKVYRTLDSVGFWKESDTLKIMKLPNTLLITYLLNNTRRKVFLKDFVSSYLGKPMRYLIESEIQFVNELKDMAHTEYLIDQAEDIGVTKQKLYILDRINFQNELMLNVYRQNEFRNITEHEKRIEKLKRQYKLILNNLKVH